MEVFKPYALLKVSSLVEGNTLLRQSNSTLPKEKHGGKTTAHNLQNMNFSKVGQIDKETKSNPRAFPGIINRKCGLIGKNSEEVNILLPASMKCASSASYYIISIPISSGYLLVGNHYLNNGTRKVHQ